MHSYEARLPLRRATGPAWAAAVLADFPAFLVDHAACERKAAALCMSFAGKYVHEPLIVETMISLAREELEHYQQVYRLIVKRGIAIGADEKDPYVQELLKEVREADPELRRLDRLIVCALIEARSSERFRILADALDDPELKAFYGDLARGEAGHHVVFVRLAERLHGESATAAALDRLLDAEARIVGTGPVRPAVH